MTRCPHCRRHHLATESSCPFCDKRTTRRLGVPQSVAAAFSAFVLMACYGAPPGTFETDTDSGDATEDIDQDGYGADVDCDDNDSAVNPGALEDCVDLIDNDCDDLIDAADIDDCTTR